MRPIQYVTHKAGDTLVWDCRRVDGDGNPVRIEHVSACFQTIGSLNVIIIGDRDAGVFVLYATAATTATWPKGRYLGDVTFTEYGRESSETCMLIVEAGYEC